MGVIKMSEQNDYMKNAQGHLVPREMVPEIDIVRDELVMEIVREAEKLRSLMQAFKNKINGDIAAFISLSSERYGAKVGGNKGNVTLTSFDGRYKIVRANTDSVTFDERLLAAKDLIDQCIHRWTDGSSPEIRALVEHAFQTDKTGKINTGRVLGLTKLDIKDEQWKQAMLAIRDSVTIAGSKMYFRVHERIGQSDNWRQISLDIASL
jgi:hypothetical protein